MAGVIETIELIEVHCEAGTILEFMHLFEELKAEILSQESRLPPVLVTYPG